MVNWLNINPTAGTAGETTVVTLTPASANTGRLARTGTLKFKIGSDVKNTLPITQAASPLAVNPSVSTLGAINASGGSASFSATTNGYALQVQWSGNTSNRKTVCKLPFLCPVSCEIKNIVGVKLTSNSTNSTASTLVFVNKIFGGLKSAPGSAPAKEFVDGTRSIFICGTEDELSATLNSIRNTSTDDMSGVDFLEDLRATMYYTANTSPSFSGWFASYNCVVISSGSGQYIAYTEEIPGLIIPPYTGLTTASSEIKLVVSGESETAYSSISFTQVPAAIDIDVNKVDFTSADPVNVTVTGTDDWTTELEQTQLP